MSPQRRRREELSTEVGTTGLGRWLLTYSDMITLLLILFVVLFALSTVNARKFEQLRESVVNSLGGKLSANLPANTGILPHQRSLVRPASAGAAPTTPGLPAALTGQLPVQDTQIVAALQKALAAAGLSGDVTITPTERGVVVDVLSDKVFYGVDSASPGPLGNAIIDTVAKVIAPLANHVVVEGYTDNQPIIGGPYSSNWELSVMRAVNVVLRLVRVDGIAKGRMAAEGFSDTRPVASNATPAGQAQNRRIEIVILNPGQHAA